VVDQGIPTVGAFIKADLGISAATLGIAVGAYPAGKIFGSYGAGAAADRFGERPVLLVGGAAVAVLAAASALAPFVGLVVLLAFAGFAGSTATPAGGRLVLRAFPRERHGIALGLRQTAVPLAGVAAAAVLPWVAHVHGWRCSIFVASAITAMSLIPLARARSEVSHLESERPVGVTMGRNVALLTIWGCLLVTGQYATLTFLALDLHERAGLALTTGSLMLVAANAAGAVGRIGWGVISDQLLRIGRKPLLLAMNASGFGAALLLYLLPIRSSLVAIVVVAVVAGFSLIGFQGLWVTMVAEAAGPDRVGAATGLAITFVTIAIASSPALFGLVADAAGTYRAVWAALAVVVGLAFLPAMLLEEPEG
jgi:predicted MFS family arabinose efflux permease